MNKSLVPPHLIDDIVTNNSVLFVGAGIGQPELPSGIQLAKELLDMAGRKSKEVLPLDEASQYYCQHCDGGQRRRLLRFLKKRLLSCHYPTRAHLLIASIPYFKFIVTTNYDVLLDRCLNVVPIVEDNDLAYWDEDERQIIKLHGCITRPNTIVITKEDYTNFLVHRLNGLLCQHVRSLMTTKTVLFVGYRLDDNNFRVINEQIRARMQSLQGQSYAVQLNPCPDDMGYWAKTGVDIIDATAEHFLSAIQSELIRQNLLVDPALLSILMDERRRIKAKYERPASVDSPYVLLVSYLDGVLEAISELEKLTQGGVTWQHIYDRLIAELAEFEEYAKKGDLPQFVFCGGKAEALSWFLLRRAGHIPPYFNTDLGRPVVRMPHLHVEYDVDERSPFKTQEWHGVWIRRLHFR